MVDGGMMDGGSKQMLLHDILKCKYDLICEILKSVLIIRYMALFDYKSKFVFFTLK